MYFNVLFVVLQKTRIFYCILFSVWMLGTAVWLSIQTVPLRHDTCLSAKDYTARAVLMQCCFCVMLFLTTSFTMFVVKFIFVLILAAAQLTCLQPCLVLQGWPTCPSVILSLRVGQLWCVGINLIHDFTAVTFSVKLIFFRENAYFREIRDFSWILTLLLSFMKVSAAFVWILLFATMCHTSALNSWQVFTVLLTYIPPH